MELNVLNPNTDAYTEEFGVMVLNNRKKVLMETIYADALEYWFRQLRESDLVKKKKRIQIVFFTHITNDGKLDTMIMDFFPMITLYKLFEYEEKGKAIIEVYSFSYWSLAKIQYDFMNTFYHDLDFSKTTQFLRNADCDRTYILFKKPKTYELLEKIPADNAVCVKSAVYFKCEMHRKRSIAVILSYSNFSRFVEYMYHKAVTEKKEVVFYIGENGKQIESTIDNFELVYRRGKLSIMKHKDFTDMEQDNLLSILPFKS